MISWLSELHAHISLRPSSYSTAAHLRGRSRTSHNRCPCLGFICTVHDFFGTALLPNPTSIVPHCHSGVIWAPGVWCNVFPSSVTCCFTHTLWDLHWWLCSPSCTHDIQGLSSHVILSLYLHLFSLSLTWCTLCSYCLLNYFIPNSSISMGKPFSLLNVSFLGLFCIFSCLS